MAAQGPRLSRKHRQSPSRPPGDRRPAVFYRGAPKPAPEPSEPCFGRGSCGHLRRRGNVRESFSEFTVPMSLRSLFRAGAIISVLIQAAPALAATPGGTGNFQAWLDEIKKEDAGQGPSP